MIPGIPGLGGGPPLPPPGGVPVFGGGTGAAGGAVDTPQQPPGGLSTKPPDFQGDPAQYGLDPKILQLLQSGQITLAQARQMYAPHLPGGRQGGQPGGDPAVPIGPQPTNPLIGQGQGPYTRPMPGFQPPGIGTQPPAPPPTPQPQGGRRGYTPPARAGGAPGLIPGQNPYGPR